MERTNVKEKKVSIVVPCFNEEETLLVFYKALKTALQKIKNCESEMIFVNDGSKDNTLDILKQLAARDLRVKYISFSRNFGKENAMKAGFDKCTGDYIAVCDADMQDPPDMIPEMIRIVSEEDYDCAAARRATRKGEPAVRSFFARKFYHVINRISDIELVDGARDFRVMNRTYLDSVLEMNEHNRFSKGIFQWVGYKTKWLEYENIERAAGTTSWSFWGLARYAVEGIVSFSQVPVVLPFIIGTGTVILSVILAAAAAVKALIFSSPVTGTLWLMILMTFFFGILLASVGIAGKYISNIMLEVKNRPQYIISETNLSAAAGRSVSMFKYMDTRTNAGRM